MRVRVLGMSLDMDLGMGPTFGMCEVSLGIGYGMRVCEYGYVRVELGYWVCYGSVFVGM